MTEWKISNDLVAYEDALREMDARVAAIHAGEADDLVWLLEHPPLYTAGTSAKAPDLLVDDLPVHEAGRGGEYTYHGPGQRVGYVMMDLKQHAKRKAQKHTRLPCESSGLLMHEKDPRLHGESRKVKAIPDVKAYVCGLENWIIKALEVFDIKGERREGRIGIWVDTEQGEKKIAAIGVRVRHWITLHGVSINIDPNMRHFDGIVPCGISDYGVTSLRELLGRDVAMAEVDAALKDAWAQVFG